MHTSSPWLVVGLGNPGPKYAGHRHNVGFMVADAWADEWVPLPSWQQRWKSLTLTISGNPELGRCVVLKPQTYMNRSGGAVAEAATFHKVPAEKIVVVHDELDFSVGRVALKRGGGHGGHNGLRDIIQRIGSREFLRVRIGIGRPPHGDVTNWVLTDFQDEDADFLPDSIERAKSVIKCVMADGVDFAMNRFNAAG